jgi:hypothetical protein
LEHGFADFADGEMELGRRKAWLVFLAVLVALALVLAWVHHY